MLRPAPTTITANSVKNTARLCVLGVDPAVAGATGYGVVEFIGSAPRLLRFGALKLPARATFAARSESQHRRLRRRVQTADAADGNFRPGIDRIPPAGRRRRRPRRRALPRAQFPRPRTHARLHHRAPRESSSRLRTQRDE